MIFDFEKIASLETRSRASFVAKHSLLQYEPFHILRKEYGFAEIEDTREIKTNRNRIVSASDLTYIEKFHSLRVNDEDFFYTFPKHIWLNFHDDPRNNQDFSKALRFLQNTSNRFYDLFDVLIDKIVPLEPFRSHWGSGTTIEALRGYLFIGPSSTDKWKSDLVISIGIAHELAHHVLSLIHSGDQLVQKRGSVAYSGIRGNFRPAVLALHGLVALCYMKEYLSDVSKSAYEYYDINQREMLLEIDSMARSTIESLADLEFTEVGNLIFRESSAVFSGC